ncbi:MAG: bifunctional diaminohydroxyphosphoribosylaminopyrimidine deaminase/5-amino-6-(5-phosphoribosylamino)uracil reductase RibD [Halodesulfovibrio sp.]
MGHPFEPFMREAIALAEQGRWHAAPNPTVGAVLVKDGVIVARGYHTACGQPHAEVECLRDAAAQGVDPAQCTLVVTLEPCNHYGKTPPCSKAVLDAGIRHVVVGLLDPNPKAKGGAEFLRENGVLVDSGVLEQECRDLVADFLTWVETPLPYTILKLASTLDGKIATRSGNSRWISGPESRARVHELRRNVGAVIVGGTTFRKDNPQLTCRIEGVEKQPLAVIITSQLPNVPEAYKLLTERPEQTIFWTSEESAATDAAKGLRDKGCTVMPLPVMEGDTLGGRDIGYGLRWLRNEHKCLYTLCEGGGRLALAMLELGLAQEFQLHMAPKIMADAKAPGLFDGRAPATMDEVLGLRMIATEKSGDDIIITLRRRED